MSETLRKIGCHQISLDNPSYIIAEIGNNHNGDFELAKHLVDMAIDQMLIV